MSHKLCFPLFRLFFSSSICCVYPSSAPSLHFIPKIPAETAVFFLFFIYSIFHASIGSSLSIFCFTLFLSPSLRAFQGLISLWYSFYYFFMPFSSCLPLCLPSAFSLFVIGLLLFIHSFIHSLYSFLYVFLIYGIYIFVLTHSHPSI